MARQLKKPWLSSYMDFTAESESPRQYNLWCGLSAISCSLKNRVYMVRHPYKIYPNQYVILVGPPGVGKGTAINPATDLVKEASTANFISDKITPEKILEVLAAGFTGVTTTQTAGGHVNVLSTKDSTATIVSTELPILLQTSEWMLPLMCELWEKGEFTYSTKTKSSFTAKGLCVGLIAGCVPNYISKLNKEAMAAVTGGFTSRCVFVYAGEKGKHIPWPSINGNFQSLHDNLINDLQHIGLLNGQFQFAQETRKLWEEFYNGDSIKADQFESEVVSGFKARMVSHVIKVAMCLSVSEGDSLILKRDHLFNAIALIEAVKKELDVTFRSVGESSLAVAQDRVLRYIELRGYVSRSQILRDNYRHVTDEDLNRILLVLTSAGFITEETKQSKLWYKHTGKQIVIKP